MLNLSVVLESSARNYAEKTAVVFGDMRLTYAQLNGASNQIANGLIAHGVKPGDRIALSCPNLPFFPMVYYGILKAGAVVVPLNVLLKGEEIAYHLQDSQAVAYFCFEGTAELPMAQNGFAGFGDAPDCRNMWVMTAGGDSPIKEAPALKELMGTQPPTCEPCLSEPTDTAVILYTSGGFPIYRKGSYCVRLTLITPPA